MSNAPGDSLHGAIGPDAGVNATVQSLTVLVADVRAEAKDAITIELRAVDGGDLPIFSPGAHLDVHLPNGLVRNYSLDQRLARAQPLRDRRRASGGQSRRVELHPLNPQSRCPAQDQPPSQQLRSRRDSASFLFIAGGIGDHSDHGDDPLVHREREAMAPDLRRPKPSARGILRRVVRAGAGSSPFPLR